MAEEFTTPGLASGQLPARETSVNLEIDYPERLSRSLLFVKWLFVVPAYIVLILYGIAVFITTFISFWAILFTGRYPSGPFDYARGYMALYARTAAYFPLLLTDRYPLFQRAGADEEVRYAVEEPERLSRWLLLLKLVTFLLGVVATLTGVVVLILTLSAIPAWFAILFMGRYPRAMFNFVVAMVQWATRVTAWEFLMRDEWSLFATTRPIAFLVRTGAGAVVVGLFLISSPTALVPPGRNLQIEGSGMQPTLQSGQYLLANKAVYAFRSPRRGDVVVFRAPNQAPGQPEREFIKRIIGEPGETVEVRDQTVFIDGQPLAEPYILEAPNYTFGPETVPADHYFVLGDNRNNSSDSHVASVGMVPEENISGQAWLIYWPRSAFGLVDNTSVEPGSISE